MAGDEEWAEPVEIVGGDESTAEIAGGRTVDWHRLVRTGAAVVGALSLLWIGRSYADQADATRNQSCMTDVERAYWRYEQTAYGSDGPPDMDGAFTNEVLDELVAAARECDATTYADALERTRPTDDG